jgi:hypothetical protein
LSYLYHTNQQISIDFSSTAYTLDIVDPVMEPIKRIDIRNQNEDIVGGWWKLVNGDECGWYAPYLPMINRCVRESSLDTAQSPASVKAIARMIFHTPDYLAVTRDVVEGTLVAAP